MLKPLPLLFHALPILPLVFGWPYIFLASLLLVALPYIKTKKIAARIALMGEHPASGRRAREIAELDKLMAMWKALTFLS